MKKGGISIDADYGPPRHVLRYCSGICEVDFTFIQIGSGPTVHISDSAIYCFSVALKEVQIKVNPHRNCGGGATTVKIMIYDKAGAECHTKAIQYPTGKKVVWNSNDQLKDCAEKKFNPKESKIYSKIKPTDNAMDYCIDDVAVILDNQNLTKYWEKTEDKWRKGTSDPFVLTKIRNNLYFGS